MIGILDMIVYWNEGIEILTSHCRSDFIRIEIIWADRETVSGKRDSSLQKLGH